MVSATTGNDSTINEITGALTRTIGHRLVVAMTFPDAACMLDSPPGVGMHTKLVDPRGRDDTGVVDLMG